MKHHIKTGQGSYEKRIDLSTWDKADWFCLFAVVVLGTILAIAGLTL